MPGNENRLPMRDVRVPDELWTAARESVKWRGDPSLAHVIRRALRAYVAATRRRQEAGEPGGRRMPRLPTTPGRRLGRQRHVKVPDELWEAAVEAVKWRGDPSVSHVIRRALAQYVAGTRKRQQEAGE